MPGSFRLTAICFGALLVSGQAGCALTPETGVGAQAGAPTATVVLTSVSTGFDADPSGSAANPTNFVEPRDTESSALADGFTPGYSNTFIAEMLDEYGLPVFAEADYHDWGGYPVYYPYPYATGPGSSVDPWSTGFGGGPRTGGFYNGYSRSAGATGQASGSGRGIASSKGRRLAAGARSKAGNARAKRHVFAHRPADSGRQYRSDSPSSGKGSGRQHRSDNPSSGDGSGRQSSHYAAGQNRGSQIGRASKNSGYSGSGHRSSGQGYRARQSGMSVSHRVGRRLAGFRRTGPRP